MFNQMRQQRPEQCISDLRFDACAAGELADAERHALQQHVAACARCHARERALRELRARFAAQQPGRVPVDRSGSGVRPIARGAGATRASQARTWLLAATVSVAAAAAALLVIESRAAPDRDGSPTHPLASAPPSGERAKGAEHIAYFLKRGEQVQRGAREQSVQRGDKLRFLYSATRARYLAIVSLDSARQVSVFYPASARAERIEPGVDVALPSAVELDGAPGDERVYALFCDAPVELAALRAELQKQGDAFAAPAGCAMDALVLHRAGGTEVER